MLKSGQCTALLQVAALHTLHPYLGGLLKYDACIGKVPVPLIELGKSRPQGVQLAHSLQAEGGLEISQRSRTFPATAAGVLQDTESPSPPTAAVLQLGSLRCATV